MQVLGGNHRDNIQGRDVGHTGKVPHGTAWPGFVGGGMSHAQVTWVAKQ